MTRTGRRGSEASKPVGNAANQEGENPGAGCSLHRIDAGLRTGLDLIHLSISVIPRGFKVLHGGIITAGLL